MLNFENLDRAQFDVLPPYGIPEIKSISTHALHIGSYCKWKNRRR